ncbi:class I SAM-dependent RNA methyltransferase [Mycolicibacterium brumae]|uniref:Class I SAM-dependent RNA methyltransferase n=1 Tax=Mycolicibacterium brumae TaxID=85968 RepID=A0A2G5PDD8_9MYCO|nr:TRAM domain-containing protein [Mycolicibacterium brumae]MCV7193521.1 class I SAM-dependent RNA methyltransferase [Mycolicibacterium brumae]PIB76100.1 class I SAM-dependent RNA methyltransferase [Mycolicibacterium brumae]UWW09206.1 TRAM domain-containing protein [Mycolicibacterium brumae]
MSADELVLTADAPANGGSCVARDDGRVVFVRYALPGETVRARVTSRRSGYWHAEAVEILEPSPDRIDPLCPIAGPHGAGCCDLSFAAPAAARRLKGAVVANQLSRLGGFDGAELVAEPVGAGGPTGWRTRVRLEVGADGHPGFHRFHSDELVTDLNCGQLPAGLLAELPADVLRAGDQVHVVLDDDGERHVVCAGKGRRTRVAQGEYLATQRVAGRTWRLPVTAFWQAHRDAAATYSALVADWAQPPDGAPAWDLYGGAGLFAAALAEAGARVVSVDTSRAGARAGRDALADLPQVRFVTDSVRRAVGALEPAAVAVLDPPRTGAGREVIEAVAAAGVPRLIHIGCEAASFARDIGGYRSAGYRVEQLRVFDAFPLTHHVECVALLTVD